jgi:hypothetical protein
MNRLLGFNWASVRHGLWLGSAIGAGFVIAQYLEHHLISKWGLS